MAKRAKAWYDAAQICTNGHVINSMAILHPEHNKKYCDRCGASTITKCQNCKASIRGRYQEAGVEFIYSTPLTRPSFCHKCGEPYPWTEAKLKAARELSDELDNLSPQERSLLKKSLDDIVRDTPQTPVAINRFKMLVAKAGKPAADAFRDILVDILSEAIKKSIWP